MELDKRIIKGKRPLTCIDIEQAREFVGKECIFSDKYENFKNLDKYLFVDNSDYSAILSIDDYTRNGDYVFRNAKNGAHYGLILPLDWVKKHEKKYRPYNDVQELLDDIGIILGDEIHFRIKNTTEKEEEYYTLVTGYKGTKKVSFGDVGYYSLNELFDMFEISTADGWKPFGVEE